MKRKLMRIVCFVLGGHVSTSNFQYDICDRCHDVAPDTVQPGEYIDLGWRVTKW